MQCEEFEERLNQLLDRRVRPETDAALLAHAQMCSGCRETLEAQQALFDTLDSLDSPEPTADFSRRVVGKVVTQRRARTWRRTVFFLAGLAAGIVLAIFIVPRGSESDSGVGRSNSVPKVPDPRPPEAPTTTVVEADDPPEGPAEEMAAAQPPATDPYAEFLEAVRLQQEELADAQKNGDRYLVALEDWGNTLVALPSGPIEPDSLPGGIKPLAESIGAAFDLLQAPADEPPSGSRG